MSLRTRQLFVYILLLVLGFAPLPAFSVAVSTLSISSGGGKHCQMEMSGAEHAGHVEQVHRSNPMNPGMVCDKCSSQDCQSGGCKSLSCSMGHGQVPFLLCNFSPTSFQPAVPLSLTREGVFITRNDPPLIKPPIPFHS